MSVLPKPSVMPWTAPKVRLTATMPATMPVATGSIAAASARSEAKASSSKLPITTLPTIASKRTSRSICARLCAANTPGPLASSRNCGEAGVAGALSAPKALRARAIAADCASRSAPAARVVASSSARGAVRATHTPCSLLGMLGAMSDSAMRCVSPVGSRASSGLSALPAGVPSSESVSSMASRRPAAV